MKSSIRRPLIGLLALAVIAGAGLFVFPEKTDPGLELTLGPDREACTVIMVGKAASADGSTMTTHTCDCGTLRLDLRDRPGGRL